MCSTNSSERWNKPAVTGNFQMNMQIFRVFHIFSAAFLLLSIGIIANVSAASDVSVKAELSRPEVNAGEMAELQVKVTGADIANVPREIAVEGLQIRLTGQSTQVQMVNFKVSSSAIYSYIVMPLRTGKFTIPSIPVRSNAGMLQTVPLSFSVIDGSGAVASNIGAIMAPPSPPLQPGMPGFSQRSMRPTPQRSETGKLAFAEISCPKKTLYLGEVVPVEIRYYFDAHYQVQVMGKVDFGSEGILVDRFSDPKESHEDRDGVTYNVLSFHTLLSAVKPGTIEVAPAKLDSQIQMPGDLPAGFDDPIFQQLLGGRSPMTQPKKVTVATAPLHLEILPLPKEGRPASFAGAVGQFDMEAIVANPKPAPGDPAVLTIRVGGKGNFHAMGAPVLTETEGWRTYPPADKFDSSDQLSLTGVKSFDFTLIAQQAIKASPGSEFAYFDPIAANYVKLTTKPQQLNASPTATPASSIATPSLQPAPQQGASPAPVMPRGTSTDVISSLTLHSWKTPAQRAKFLIATLALLVATLALTGILHFRNLQAQRGSATARRRRLADLLASLKTDTLDAASSYEAALEYIQLLAAPESETVLTELTTRRDLLKYGVGGSVALGRDERAQLMETLRTLSSYKASS